MANNKDGGAKLVETMTKKYGSYEAFRESMRERASKGGKNSNTGGVANDRERAAEIGAIGGKYSRRGYKLIERYATYGIYVNKSNGETVRFNYV